MGSQREICCSKGNNAAQMTQSLRDAAIKLWGAPRLGAKQDIISALDIAVIVAVTDFRGTFTYVNSKFCEVSGYSETELIGENHRKVKSGQHDVAFFRAMYREIEQGRIWHGEICNRRKDGSLYWVDTTIVPNLSERGKADSYTSIHFDITDRKQLEVERWASREQLKRIAHLDPLTGLPNRRSFRQLLETTIRQLTDFGRTFHLALLDVDTFKEINDSFGHSAGDYLLQTVASRLRELCQTKGFTARLGGDEFGIILTDVTPAAAEAFFEKALEKIRQPIQIGLTSRRLSASLGVSVFPEDGNDAENLFQSADLALYHAKSLGRDRFELFHANLKTVAKHRSQLLSEIEHGLRRDGFELHYQPIVPVVRNGLISLEALIRWRHPQQGLLTPSTFKDGFSDPAVRAAIGMFVLQKSFYDLADMLAAQFPLQNVAINLTNSDFRSDAFVDRFFELCEETKIGPEKLCVEVTESMFLGIHQERVERGLRRLHEAGVEIAFDDFGTGNASLTHLRHLPIDKLKIDRSFVANMAACPEDQAIVRGIIDIAHSLDKAVTAEGVETKEQVELLADMKCDYMQGWYFSQASPPDRLAKLITSLLPGIE
ncbi:EAL domain-containing protein [Ensifer sp. ENS01]|uniref:putative bifunctional diguanylate cyclase/phosphodiesterase n=1 Tax=Ensifer sp. ENS01 TaxID=2769293 RepID=UPI0019C286E7|nr:EAL domain-containing protein [Ensifer sp. ENS01]MBD9497875.1 EAL domain-containing protein [Ensifer sp. ENS01]